MARGQHGSRVVAQRAEWLVGCSDLHFDTGSETLARLEGKLPGYSALTRAVDHPTWVCFAFLTAAREASARRVLIHPEVPVATAVVSPDSAAGGPVWLAIGDVGGPLQT